MTHPPLEFGARTNHVFMKVGTSIGGAGGDVSVIRTLGAMSFYQDHILPRLIHLAMSQANLAAYRNRVVPAAEGRVLEIGIGSGRGHAGQLLTAYMAWPDD